MRDRRESPGRSLLRRYLEHVEIRSVSTPPYAGFPSPIARRRYAANLLLTHPSTVIDVTTPSRSKELGVEGLTI